MRMRTRLALTTAGCLTAVLAGGLIIVGRVPQVVRTTGPDLSVLTESMLIEESAVPPIAGTTWGRMVAVPRGVPPPVSPPDCGLFLSQAEASQKGLAMRSARGTAIGVELAITDAPQDLEALMLQCRSFTFDGGATQSRIEMEPLNIVDVPTDSIATLMHCQSVTGGKTTSWDIAMIAGYHRGVLVDAQYTPGPVGGSFDDTLAASLSGIYRAQIDRLDGV